MKFPNTCYRFQLAEHKIRGFPLAVPRVKPPPKEAPLKLVEGKKKEEWTTIGHKGKAPSTPKFSHVAIVLVPPISIGAQTPAIVGMQVVF